MIFPLEIEFLDQYSAKTRRTYKTRFQEFKTFIIAKGRTNITEVQKMDIDEYCRDVVEPKHFRQETKERHYSLIRNYFKFLLDNNGSGELFIKLATKMNFTDFIRPELLKRQARELPDIEDMKKILTHARKVNPRIFIYLAIMFHNGLRDSELRSTKLANIRHIQTKIREAGELHDIEFTYITTGEVEEHKKMGQVFYFIPSRLENSLEWKIYLKQLQFYQNPLYLFQVEHFPTEKTGFISNKSINKNLRKYEEKLQLGGLAVNPHIYRDVLNEYRMEIGCDPALREILLFHNSKSTNSKYYLKKCQKIQYRYKYWEQFTPDLLEEIL